MGVVQINLLHMCRWTCLDSSPFCFVSLFLALLLPRKLSPRNISAIITFIHKNCLHKVSSITICENSVP